MNLKTIFIILGFISFISSASAQEKDSITISKKSSKTEKKAEKKRKKENYSEKPAPDENRFAKYTTMYELIRAELPEIQITGNSILIRGYTSVQAAHSRYLL